MNISKEVKIIIENDIKKNDIYNILSSSRVEIPKSDYVEYDLSDDYTEAYFYPDKKDRISELAISYKDKNGYITFKKPTGLSYKYPSLFVKVFNESILCYEKKYFCNVDILDENNESLSIEDIKIGKRYLFKFV